MPLDIENSVYDQPALSVALYGNLLYNLGQIGLDHRLVKDVEDESAVSHRQETWWAGLVIETDGQDGHATV